MVYSFIDGSALIICFFFFLFVLFFIFQAASLFMVYRKARKPGWGVFIPFYNLILLLKIVNKPGWWFFIFLVPGLNLVLGIWVIHLLSKSFGQSTGFTFGLVILPFIFYPLLAFGKFRYTHPSATEQHAYL